MMHMDSKATIAPADFAACDLRVGTVQSATPLEGARRPAYVLLIDFGPLGTLKSTAQLVQDYAADTLRGKQVVALVNVPPKQVGSHMSSCLVLGAVEGESVSLLEVSRPVAPGTPIA